MAKAKQSKGKRRRFRVVVSFEPNSKLLPKSKRGILVKDEEFTIREGQWFHVDKLERLLLKEYLRELNPKKLKEKGAYA